MGFGIAKKALYNANLFIADNGNPTHRDGRTNKCDIIDYIISSPAIFNKNSKSHPKQRSFF